jgi:hypothetical protein
MGRLRILGLALGLLALGCVSPDKARLLKDFHNTPAGDLGESDSPRLSRLQSGPDQGSAYQHELRIKVRAWVNGQPIFDDDIYQSILPDMPRIFRLPEPERSKEQARVYKLILDQFIERELLYQDAIHKLEMAKNDKMIKKLNEIAKQEFTKKIRLLEERSKLSPEAFLELLHKQGATLESMERLERTKFFANEYLRSIIFERIKTIGHIQAKEYYDTHMNQFWREDSVHWQDLFVAVGPKHPTREQARAFAEEIVARLRNGEDFKKFLPYDDGTSHYNDGEGTGHKRGQIEPPELEKYLFQLFDGDVGPVVELSTGFHVIRLIRREYAGQIPFNQETQKIILNKLKNELADREAKKIIEDLKSRAVIEIERD